MAWGFGVQLFDRFLKALIAIFSEEESIIICDFIIEPGFFSHLVLFKECLGYKIFRNYLDLLAYTHHS